VLTKVGVPATFFIATGFLNGGCMWNDVVIDSVARTRRSSFECVDPQLGTLDLSSTAARLAAITRLLASLKYVEQGARARRAAELARALDVEPQRTLMMSTDHVRDLIASGFDIGAHTVNHPILSSLDAATARREVAESKRMLERVLGREVRLFAYPNGRPGDDYGQRECDIVQDAGFLAAFSTRAAVVDETAKVFELPRIAPWDRSGIKHCARLLWAAWTGRV
jgi:peptidoglycan/xylan/chitin deacetylase (PgdA/CDA1 family)